MQAPQVFLDAGFADIDAVESDLDGALIAEEIRRFAPEAPIDVVTEGALQLLDGARALELLDPGRQRVDLRIERPALRVSGLA